MSSHIHSWIDGYLALRDRAYETRGFVELDDSVRRAGRARPAPTSSRSPRCSIRRCARTARPASLRRWRATLDDLERDALTAPRETYAREPRVLGELRGRRGLPRRRRRAGAAGGDVGRADRRRSAQRDAAQRRAERGRAVRALRGHQDVRRPVERTAASTSPSKRGSDMLAPPPASAAGTTADTAHDERRRAPARDVLEPRSSRTSSTRWATTASWRVEGRARRRRQAREARQAGRRLPEEQRVLARAARGRDPDRGRPTRRRPSGTWSSSSVKDSITHLPRERSSASRARAPISSRARRTPSARSRTRPGRACSPGSARRS